MWWFLLVSCCIVCSFVWMFGWFCCVWFSGMLCWMVCMVGCVSVCVGNGRFCVLSWWILFMSIGICYGYGLSVCVMGWRFICMIVVFLVCCWCCLRWFSWCWVIGMILNSGCCDVSVSWIWCLCVRFGWYVLNWFGSVLDGFC